ncbi:MAG: phage portal protein [Clostridia bacterium]|nr:phage portal protein [Clostridia bacterium]
MAKAGADAGLSRAFRDIFEVGGVPAYRQFYENGIFVWKALYRGSYAPWHLVPAPTIANPKAMRQLYRLNAAKAVSAELAGLVWSEQCDVRVSVNGGAEGDRDPLNTFVHHVLRENAFNEKMQQLIEQGLALGGAAIKVWAEDEGPQSGRIRLGYCAADQFVPVAWDNAQVKEAVFISREAKDGHYYTRLEWHRRDGETYRVDNEVYRSEPRHGAPGQDQDILGVRYPLEAVYPELDEHAEARVKDSLFTYWHTPIANNLDDDSPLGISIYGNALETLRALDICYDSFVQEFELGKKRIIVPARCVRTVADPSTGEMRRYFDPGDRVYEALATDDAGELRIQDNSVELRVEEHVAALNAFLSVLCLQLGFSANTFSFDGHSGLKTATEVVSENSKTYKTIHTIQNQLRPALEHLTRNIIDVAILYGLSWEGRSVESLAANGYQVKAVFDDGVTQDRQTNIAEGLKLVEAGLLSRYRFLTDVKYGQGLTPGEAEEELRRLKAESV